MKLIIALWNTTNRGKSQTLRRVAELIAGRPTAKILEEKNFHSNRKDFKVILRVSGIKIAVESKGDPGTNLDGRLEELIDQKCKVIFCATRMRGKTARSVDTLAKTNRYTVIWTSTYETYKPSDQPRLNKMKARHLVNLMKRVTGLTF